MFKVATASAFAALFAALSFTAFMAYTTFAQTDQSVDWAESLKAAARELDIDLTDECMAELRDHILAFGFERGAVTTGGVLMRDRYGVDKWLCLS